MNLLDDVQNQMQPVPIGAQYTKRHEAPQDDIVKLGQLSTAERCAERWIHLAVHLRSLRNLETSQCDGDGRQRNAGAPTRQIKRNGGAGKRDKTEMF